MQANHKAGSIAKSARDIVLHNFFKIPYTDSKPKINKKTDEKWQQLRTQNIYKAI